MLGKYYLACDSVDKARTELDEALKEEVITPNVYLTYGQLLSREGDFAQSNKMLKKAEEAYYEIDSKGFGHIQTWKLMSENFRKLGNPKLALEYLDLYIHARDSINNLRNMEEINSYKVKFDVEKKELELARNRATMKSQSITLWAVFSVIALTIVFYIFYSVRRRKIHRLIVRQQKDFIMEQTSALSNHAVPDSSVDETLPDSEARKGLTPDKAAAIWNLIEHEMEENRIYADTTVTRDIFSERVGCNHTWFSQVIKEKTGKSYLQFMNSRRIKEALKILSDSSNDITLKDLAAQLGFLSASTFYSTFRQQVGMTPSEYRKLAISESRRAEID